MSLWWCTATVTGGDENGEIWAANYEEAAEEFIEALYENGVPVADGDEVVVTVDGEGPRTGESYTVLVVVEAAHKFYAKRDDAPYQAGTPSAD